MKFYMWLRKIWLLVIYRFRQPKIQITKAQLSGNNNFIDIRYRLSRPDKIKGITPICMKEGETGQILHLMNLPKFGAVRTKHSKYQTSGILLFRNQNNIIKLGSKVTIMYGSLKVNNIEIE